MYVFEDTNETVPNPICVVSSTVEALLNPPGGAYLISDTPEGGLIERGLIREGAYSQNQVARMYLVAF